MFCGHFESDPTRLDIKKSVSIAKVVFCPLLFFCPFSEVVRSLIFFLVFLDNSLSMISLTNPSVYHGTYDTLNACYEIPTRTARLLIRRWCDVQGLIRIIILYIQESLFSDRFPYKIWVCNMNVVLLDRIELVLTQNISII